MSAIPGLKNLSFRDIHAGDIATLLREAQGEETDTCSQIENALAGKAYTECSKGVEESIRIIGAPCGIVLAGLAPIDRVAAIDVSEIHNFTMENAV